jgi:hypothetical protein
MRDRWTLLLVTSSIGLLGAFAGILAHADRLASWLWLGVFALVIGVMVRAHQLAVHARWPAAVALISVAPLVRELLDVNRANLVWEPGRMLVDAASSMVALFAVVVLVGYAPPNPEDPIARVRVL